MDIAVLEPQAEAGGGLFSLSRFLRTLASDGPCFCCGSPTHLMLDGSGLLSVRCPDCNAEIAAVNTARDAANEPVLQAA